MAKRGRKPVLSDAEREARSEARRAERDAYVRRRDAVAKWVDVDGAVESGLGIVRDAGVEAGTVEEFEAAMNIPAGRGAKFLEAFALVAAGNRWKKVQERTGLTYSELSCRCHANKVYRELFALVRGRQSEALAAKAHDALDEIVEEGERIPVVAGGKVIDERRTRPVKAIELALKVGDQRFREGGAGGPAGGVTFQIVMPNGQGVGAKGSEPVEVEPVKTGSASGGSVPAGSKRLDFSEDD